MNLFPRTTTAEVTRALSRLAGSARLTNTFKHSLTIEFHYGRKNSTGSRKRSSNVLRLCLLKEP